MVRHLLRNTQQQSHRDPIYHANLISIHNTPTLIYEGDKIPLTVTYPDLVTLANESTNKLVIILKLTVYFHLTSCQGTTTYLVNKLIILQGLGTIKKKSLNLSSEMRNVINSK